MDLGDFTPEEYSFAFAISGRRYAVNFSEASVDGVLKIIWKQQDSTMDSIDLSRLIVSTFLPDHLTEGSAEQLREDLKTLPYINRKDPQGLSIQKLDLTLQSRIKKNDRGEAAETMQADPSGSSETSAS